MWQGELKFVNVMSTLDFRRCEAARSQMQLRASVRKGRDLDDVKRRGQNVTFQADIAAAQLEAAENNDRSDTCNRNNGRSEADIPSGGWKCSWEFK
jgi:hypothetical protein